jgi:hypothetical protein
MIKHQTSAMPIQMISCLPIGVCHQIRSDGGKNELILYSPQDSGRDRDRGDFHDTPQDVKYRRHCDPREQQQEWVLEYSLKEGDALGCWYIALF